MKAEKYIYLGLGVLALGLSFTADAMGIALSADSIWIIRGFASLTIGLGALKQIAERKVKKDG